MGYHLGVDLGTTFTAAAVLNGGGPTMLGLGNRALQIPSVLYFHADGALLVGEAAELRSGSDPARTVREFKRRIGDPVPILVSGKPYSAQALSGKLLRWVVDKATEQMGGPPVDITLTYPANWSHFKIDLLRQVAALADVTAARACSEPEAAALQYASRTRVNAGDRIAVYDLGGGTFDICVLQKTETGFRILGRPEGIEHLGGIDFDEAVFRRVIDQLPPQDLDAFSDEADETATSWLARLRRDCVEAKEALSTDVDALIPVALPGTRTSVRLTRGEFEDIIRPALEETIGAARRALRSAEIEPAQLTAMVLVGGSSRIPLVAEMLGNAFRCPIAVDTHPKNDVAMGAARAATMPDAAAPLSAPLGRPGFGPGIGRFPLTGPVAGTDQQRGSGQFRGTATGPIPPSGLGAGPIPPSGQGARPIPPRQATHTGPTPVAPPGGSGTAHSPGPGSAPGTGQSPGRWQAGGPWPPNDAANRHGPAAGTLGPPGDSPAEAVDPRRPGVQVVAADEFSGPGQPPGPTDVASRRRVIFIAVAAAVAILVAGTAIVLVLRSGDDSDATGTGSTAATSVTSDSVGSSLASTSASTTASAPATQSALGLPSSVPLGDQQLIVPGVAGDNSDLYLVDVAGNSVKARLTTDPAEDRSPVLSPDRSTIIYGQQTDTTRSLRVMAANGGGDRPLFAAPPPDCARTNRPAWNPVEANLLAIVCIDVAGKYSLQIVKLDGQVERVLTTGLARFDDVSFSPDGKRLTFWGSGPSSFDGGSIYVMAADGTGPPQPLTNEKVGTDADPMWSPDGNEIVFRRRMPGTTQQGNLDIFVMNADGQQVRQLTTDPAADQNPSWSPDGLEIAFTSRSDNDTGVADTHLWIVWKDGVRELVPTLALSEDAAPAWSRR